MCVIHFHIIIIIGISLSNAETSALRGLHPWLPPGALPLEAAGGTTSIPAWPLPNFYAGSATVCNLPQTFHKHVFDQQCLKAGWVPAAERYICSTSLQDVEIWSKKLCCFRSNSVEHTTAERSWHIAYTDSVLHTWRLIFSRACEHCHSAFVAVYAVNIGLSCWELGFLTSF